MINHFNPDVVNSYVVGTVKPSLPTFRTPDRGLTVYQTVTNYKNLLL